MPNQKRIAFLLRSNLAFAFAAGSLVLWSYLREPSEPSSAIFLGFSSLRLTLIGIVIALLLLILVVLFGLLRNSWRVETIAGQLIENQKGILWISFLGIGIAYLLLFLSDQRLGTLASYRERLLPTLIWLAVISIQLGLLIIYLIKGSRPAVSLEQRSILIPAFVILIFFGFLFLFIKITRIGLTPDNVYWQGAGAPILLPQVFLAVFAAILLFWLIEHTHLRRSNWLDLFIFLGIWGLASLVWLSQPAKPTYFSLEPRAPNFQSYPFSDALIYDSTAQEFLIGKPMPADFWVKPIYSLFLAVLHLFAGENYALLTSLQVVILASLPSFVYLLTTYLDQRLAGLLAALLLILRERNALALSDIIQLSHSKLLLSDVFAMGEMILLVWLVVWWLQQPVERRAAPVAVGGMLGLLILTRGHPILMIPFMFLASFIVLKPNLKLWYESSRRIALGLFLVLIPWFLHTYQFTGRLTFQDPSSPYAVNDTLVKLYTQPSHLETGTGSKAARSYTAFQSQAYQSLIEHPADVAYFTSAHYFHNLIFSYLYLPESFQIEDLRAYSKRLPFWNRSWDGFIPAETWILILLNFAVLSFGISVAWKKVNRLMLTPLILGAAYNLSIAVPRRSGWRFILPADWVTLVFYAIGLVQVIIVIHSLINYQEKQSEGSEPTVRRFIPSPSWGQSAVVMGLPFFFIAIGLISGHRMFPLRYPEKSTQELLQDYQSTLYASAETEFPALRNFMKQEGATILYGKAIYPIYFTADEGMWNYNWPSFSIQPYDRLAFYLIGPQSMSVNLPMESSPRHFPDGASVIVIGCKIESGDLNAVSVLIQGNHPIYYGSESFKTAACPLSESN